MAEIHIKDIESLNKLNSDTLELKKKIEEFQEIKELKELQQEEINLKNKIVKYSTYDSVKIGNIITKLMTLFEGIEYCFSKNSVRDYCIKPKSNNRDIMYIYPNYKIRNIKQERISFDTNEKKESCYLPPSSFRENPSLRHRSQNKNLEYIQLFIDYLYERRSSKLLEEIDEKELEEILQEFSSVSIELQQQRKKEIEEKIKERISKQKRKAFEKSCVIDRKLILTSLAYVINHYEENISAKLEKEEEWSRGWTWSELIGYHKLTINFNDKELFFKAKIDSEGCYPDEEYCGVSIDINKNTDICFFDIKEELSPILKHSNYQFIL